jgi:hypothetical protein
MEFIGKVYCEGDNCACKRIIDSLVTNRIVIPIDGDVGIIPASSKSIKVVEISINEVDYKELGKKKEE